MEAEEKLARQRLSILELAKELGNIAKACLRIPMICASLNRLFLMTTTSLTEVTNL